MNVERSVMYLKENALRRPKNSYSGIIWCIYETIDTFFEFLHFFFSPDPPMAITFKKVGAAGSCAASDCSFIINLNFMQYLPESRGGPYQTSEIALL